MVAVDDSLFVSVDRASIALSSKLPDVLLANGTVSAIEGHAIACHEDVTLQLDGTAFLQVLHRVEPEPARQWAVPVHGGAQDGITLLVIDPRKGTWDALVVATDLELLTNPVEVALTVGDDTGGESLGMITTRGLWTYRR